MKETFSEVLKPLMGKVEQGKLEEKNITVSSQTQKPLSDHIQNSKHCPNFFIILNLILKKLYINLKILFVEKIKIKLRNQNLDFAIFLYNSKIFNLRTHR